ncbi:MAG: helix-turn-helix domain-containing protein [Bacteroidota bacterium]
MKKQLKGKKKRKLIYNEEGIKAFAIHLKELRKKYGYTQDQLAFEAEISLSQIARIETARINPTLSTLIAIAKALDIKLSELTSFE